MLRCSAGDGGRGTGSHNPFLLPRYHTAHRPSVVVLDPCYVFRARLDFPTEWRYEVKCILRSTMRFSGGQQQSCRASEADIAGIESAVIKPQAD